MNLQVKAFVFVALMITGLLAGVHFGLQTIVSSNFDKMEEAATEKTLKDTKAIIGTVVDEFLMRGYDWSDWSDLANFVNDEDEEFRDANLTNDAMIGVNWSHFVLVRKDGSRPFQGQTNFDGDDMLPVAPELDALIKTGILTKGEPVAGFARIAGTLQMVGSRPIFMTDHSPAPKPGFMITTRIMDAEQVERLRKFTNLDVRLIPSWEQPPTEQSRVARAKLSLGAPQFIVDDANELIAYGRFKDIGGSDLFDLQISRPRALRSAANTLLGALNKGLYGFAGLLAIVSIFVMSVFVVRPLGKVLAGVHKLQAGERVQVEVKNRDEIGELAGAFNQMANTIIEREAALKLVLDSTGDGLVLMSPGGALRENASAPAIRWFGATKGKTLGEWLPLSDRVLMNLELGLEQLVDDFMPFEVTVAMLPREFEKDDRVYRLRYEEVRHNQILTDVLVIVSDATDQVNAERSEQQARELQAIGRQALRDRRSVTSFLEEADAIVAYLSSELPLADIKRAVHTLKGNAAIFGLESVSEACHDVETQLMEEPDSVASQIEWLVNLWGEARTRIESVFGKSDSASIELEEAEYQLFLQKLLDIRADKDLIKTVQTWRMIPTRAVLERLGTQVERVGERLAKDVEVTIIDDGKRLPRENLGGFLSTLIHVARNAVDHGIESESERRAVGKPPRGQVHITARQTSHMFAIEIRDDGRGINWERVREKAVGLGIPTASQHDLERALFAEGMSTAEEITDTSGRGVGMGAVEQACLEAGGTLSVDSTPGVGTVFRFMFPLAESKAA